MEERVVPSSLQDNETYDDHQDQDHHDNNGEAMNMQLVRCPMQRPHETYVIQVAKDQIYRVPPPEHAEIVERYRNPIKTKNSKRRRCGYWCLSITFVVAFIISVIVCVHRFTLSPKPPTFAIRGVNLVQNNPPGSKKTGFQFSVQTTNPNSVNDLVFRQGSALLRFKGKEIGKGTFPPPSGDKEDPGQSFVVHVVVNSDSSKGAGFPPEDNNYRHNKPFKLEISMNIPVKMKTWLWSKDIVVKVRCQVEVDSFGDNSSILSQICDLQS